MCVAYALSDGIIIPPRRLDFRRFYPPSTPLLSPLLLLLLPFLEIVLSRRASPVVMNMYVNVCMYITCLELARGKLWPEGNGRSYIKLLSLIHERFYRYTYIIHPKRKTSVGQFRTRSIQITKYRIACISTASINHLWHFHNSQIIP